MPAWLARAMSIGRTAFFVYQEVKTLKAELEITKAALAQAHETIRHLQEGREQKDEDQS